MKYPSTDEPVQADIEMEDIESVRTPEPILSSPNHGYKMQKFIGISSIGREMSDVENVQGHDRQPKGDYYLLLDKSAQEDVEMEHAGLSTAELTSSTQFHSEDQSQPPKSYQIIFDNLNFYVFAKHMTSEIQNKSVHWVNLLGVQDRITNDGLDDSKPLKSVYDLTNADFIPSLADNIDLLNDIIPQFARILVDNIKALASFKSVIVRHIPHQYSDLTSKKSQQVGFHGTCITF